MAAFEVAKIEHSMGVKSTFFFLISNVSYNPFENSNFKLIYANRKQLGIRRIISIYPTIYDDLRKGLLWKKALETAFESTVDIISIHRPNEYFQKYNRLIGKCEHTYLDKYFKDIKYVADSTGIFRFGHPFNTREFQNNESLLFIDNIQFGGFIMGILIIPNLKSSILIKRIFKITLLIKLQTFQRYQK